MNATTAAVVHPNHTTRETSRHCFSDTGYFIQLALVVCNKKTRSFLQALRVYLFGKQIPMLFLNVFQIDQLIRRRQVLEVP